MLTLMLTLFIGALMTTKPVKAAGTRLYVWQPTGYIPGVAVNSPVYAQICVEFPTGWDYTADGVVGYAFNVQVDPNVLLAFDILGAADGYYLKDFLNYYWLTNTVSLLYTTDGAAGTYTGVSEFIMGWEDLGLGAGGPGDPDHALGGPAGYGPLCKLRLRSKSQTEYSLIDISDAYYYTPAGKFPFDVVDDGHYNAPPVPEFPLGAAFQVGLIAAVAYVWWTRRHKLKEVP